MAGEEKVVRIRSNELLFCHLLSHMIPCGSLCIDGLCITTEFIKGRPCAAIIWHNGNKRNTLVFLLLRHQGNFLLELSKFVFHFLNELLPALRFSNSRSKQAYIFMDIVYGGC